jgi:hypothetical protein
MVEWLEPLELQKVFINIFAGDPDIFVAIVLIVISSFAGYFRNTISTMLFMIALFFFMFSGFISSPILILISIFGGLIGGYVVSKIF